MVKCKWFEGTETAEDVKILECLRDLLGSSDSEARKRACRILRYWSFRPQGNVEVIRSAAKTLAFTTKIAEELLESSESAVWTWACQIVRDLSHHLAVDGYFDDRHYFRMSPGNETCRLYKLDSRLDSTEQLSRRMEKGWWEMAG
ncbi:hypothetical protein FB451DRAFT_1187621 [Mycena latifolia]|nr:hypothetical protein FB451DRAFT_1187621 [Mycena latifolia]